MPDDSVSPGDTLGELETPIDLSTVDKPQLMFYLAGEVPIALDHLAERCTQSRTTVERLIRKRFGNEINIDATDFVDVSDTARRSVSRAATPFLKSAREQLNTGNSLMENEEYGQAAERFQEAASTFQGLLDRLGAFNYEPAKLKQLLVAAKQHHDSASEEKAKDVINFRTLQARQYEQKGHQATGGDRSTAAESYREAKRELEEALQVAKEYNRSRLWSESPRLSLEQLEDEIDSIDEKLREYDPESPTSDERAVQPDTQSSHPEIQDLRTDIDGLGIAGASSLKRAGYKSLSDFKGDSIEELVSIDKIGPTIAENILERARRDSLHATDPETDRTETGGDSPADSSTRANRHQALDQSAFETDWHSIPENDRIDGQLLVKVDEVTTPRGDRKTHVLQVSDRNGKRFPFDIWETHNLDIEWLEDEWYALTNARGSSWTTDSGEVRKRLSSTKDLDAISLGPEFDPDSAGETLTISNQEATKSNAETPARASTEVTQEANASTRDQTSSEESAMVDPDEGIFDDIVSDFDEL